MSNEEMITCQVAGCGETAHVMEQHLAAKHPGYTLEQYQADFPGMPIISERARKILADRAAAARPTTTATAPSVTVVPVEKKAIKRQPFHEVFGFSKTDRAALSAKGSPIGIRVFDPDELTPEARATIPDKDSDYVFNVDLTKTVVMALEMNVPIYLHGHAGVGKSTLLEQVAHHTNRGYTRVQHTANMEEADVEGRWVVDAKGEMVFQNGPLTDAMEQGLLYVADEYDFAPPMVLSVYQAVLEGKPLFIKAANKKVVPHQNFRFCATGNTNGAGDESGLYQGTMVQNAANYERFGVVEKVQYMPQKDEIEMLVRKTSIAHEDAKRIVEFATKMREGFDKNDVDIPMSPRATLNAAKLGMARNDMAFGIRCAYINRLPARSADVARQTSQRVFGS